MEDMLMIFHVLGIASFARYFLLADHLGRDAYVHSVVVHYRSRYVDHSPRSQAYAAVDVPRANPFVLRLHQRIIAVTVFLLLP